MQSSRSLLITLLIVLSTLVSAIARAQAPDSPPSSGAPDPSAVAAAARSLPPLDRTEGVVRLPLDNPGPGPGWVAIAPGMTVEARSEGLAATYRVAQGQPAGAALIVRPGTFAGVDRLVLEASANRNVQLLVTLQDADGAVFSLPSVALRVGNARRHERSLADASYFAPQSSAPDPGSLDPSRVVMVTLLDIAGFMGGGGEGSSEVRWTVESFEAFESSEGGDDEGQAASRAPSQSAGREVSR